MSKKKATEQFVNTFIYRFLKLPKGQTTPTVIIRFPDGKQQLLALVQALHPFLSVFDRIHHQGWFESQALNRLSHIGEMFIKNTDVLVVSLIDGKIVFGYRNWKSLRRSTHPNLNADLNARYYDLKPAVVPYFIRIESTTHLQLTEHGKQLVAEIVDYKPKPTDPHKLLAGYECYYNQANGCWQHRQPFGSSKDIQYGTDAGITMVIHKNSLELSTYSYGGMAGLVFSEKDRTTHPKNADHMTVNYTLKLVKTLIEEGVVLVPKKWERK